MKCIYHNGPSPLAPGEWSITPAQNPSPPGYCTWVGSRNQLKEHVLAKCGFKSIYCPRCTITTHVYKLSTHLETECLKRWVNCEWCKGVFKYDDLLSTHQVCNSKPADCECGDRTLTVGNIKEHKCPLEVIPCPHAGCGTRMKRSMLSDHMSNRDARKLHRKLYDSNLFKYLTQLTTIVEDHRVQLKKQRTRILELETKVEELVRVSASPNEVKQVDDWQLFVQTSKGTCTIFIHPTELVSSAKLQVCLKQRINSSENTQLVFNSKVLLDHLPINYFDVSHCSTLSLRT